MASIRRGEISQDRLAYNRHAKSASQVAHIERVRAKRAAGEARAVEITELLRAGKITPAEAVAML